MLDSETGLTQETLKKILFYDPDRGTWRWRVKPCQSLAAGSVAGRVRPDGYTQIKIKSRPYLAHRLAFLYMTGKWPDAYVDHINRDRTDNRFCNLRLATASQNKMNCGHSERQTVTGVRGVRMMGNKYQARLKVRGKMVYLGTFDRVEDAVSAYSAAAREHFGQFCP